MQRYGPEPNTHAQFFRHYLTKEIENDAQELLKEEDVRESNQPRKNTMSTQNVKNQFEHYPKTKPGPTQR
jgi:hypothetical protein